MDIPEGATHKSKYNSYYKWDSALGVWLFFNTSSVWEVSKLCKEANPKVLSPLTPTVKAHPHAARMAQYAEDAATTAEPWRLWECLCLHEGGWLPMGEKHPSWRLDYNYRRKPRTININGHEVPEPLRMPPAMNTQVYMPYLNGIYTLCYGNAEHWRSEDLLRAGLLHLTKEAAELHSKALLSFTEVK